MLRILIHITGCIIPVVGHSYFLKKFPLIVSSNRVVDPHSFFADQDPAVFLNADPDRVA